ncbi:MAG: sensor histidine kinase [Ignavibacteriales bacterium]|nr:MAG: sensor histidine kinase [Ignavibacteriales bacterium]
MNNGKFKKYWVISGTLAFVILFAFLVVEIYTRTIEDEKKDYQLQQLEMAKNAARGISYLLDHLLNDVKFLSSIPEIKKADSSSVSYLNRFLESFESPIIGTVFITNRNGNILHSTGNKVQDWIKDYAFESVNEKNKTGTYLTKVIRNEETKNNSEIFLLVNIPVVENKQPDPADTIGYLGYLINFNLLVEQYIKPLKLSKEDFAWIIDSEGRLIYHPHHDEMLFRSINNTTEECFNCHISFDTQRLMLSASEPSVGEYYVIADEPPKVMAYHPMLALDEKWILVISADVSKVTENLRGKFQIFFILGFIILSVILFFSILIYIVNLRRVRAEEAKRNLEQVQLYQEQLNQASKMASIGELVDSVAHEINTPAGIISAHVDGLMLKEKYKGALGDALKIIKRQTQRISDYTRSLLNYSQRMVFKPEATNIKNLVEECLYLLGHRFRAKQINIIKNYGDNIPLIKADQRQLEQVLINILNNAADAVHTRGEIKISISYSKEKEKGEGVKIEIGDNGSGISRENIDKIFNPFFSTKLNSNGTGLGLSIAKAIITRHKGNISVDSIEEEGTLFKIFLPLKVE